MKVRHFDTKFDKACRTSKLPYERQQRLKFDSRPVVVLVAIYGSFCPSNIYSPKSRTLGETKEEAQK